MSTLRPETSAQLFTLPPNAIFVVVGVHNKTPAQQALKLLGRKDVEVHCEYWVEDLSWIWDKPRPVVFDVRYESQSIWKSHRFVAAREVLRQLKRL